MSDHPFAYERQEANAARADQEYFDGPDQSEMTTLTCECALPIDREWGEEADGFYCSKCESWVEPA